MSSVLAVFESKQGLLSALEPLRAAGFVDMETYTPQPIEEGYSILPFIVLLCGFLGAAAASRC
jgi:hypothetical protein